jgi:hypothetical protein
MPSRGNCIIRDKTNGRILGTTKQPRPVTLCDCGNHAFTATVRWGVTLVSPADADLLRGSSFHLRIDGRNAYAIKKIGRKNKPLHQLRALL